MAESANPQPPAQPPYQYGGAPPANPSPNQPTGGTPEWLKRLLTPLTIIAVTVLVIWSSLGPSRHIVNDASRLTAQAMQSGPRLTPKEAVDAVNQANQRAAELEKEQARLRKQIQDQQSRNNTANTTTGTTASTGTSTTGGSSGQVSEVQQILQQIRAERTKQQYAALWSSPIVAVREVRAGGQPGAPAGKPTEPNGKPSITAADGITAPDSDPNQKRFPYDYSTGPYHVIQRSTVVGATLMNELDGEHGGPVVAQIDKDDPVYAKNTDTLLWPEGTIVSGMAQPVNSGNTQLLGVSFDRVTMPDGYAMSLETTPGLSQQGQDGLTGQVNTHWAPKLGWSLAVGAIEGLSSGAIGFGSNSNSSVILRGGGQDISQLFQGILNRPANVRIPAGTRIKIILLDDLSNVPEYAHHQMRPGVL